MLLVDRNVPILMPDSFRVEVTIKKTGLTVIGSEDILLLGGSIGDKDCSGGALFLYWSDGALGFGQQCNGPAPCPNGADCSDPAIVGPSEGLQPNVVYHVAAEYRRATGLARIIVDDKEYLTKAGVKWNPTRGGPVTRKSFAASLPTACHPLHYFMVVWRAQYWLDHILTPIKNLSLEKLTVLPCTLSQKPHGARQSLVF